MNESRFNEELHVLAKALRQHSFHFIIIGYNHPDVYRDVSEWLRVHLTGRAIQELTVSGKSYREITGELEHAGQNIVMIPDFDWLFNPENEPVCVALNQRRDYLARRELNLLCFIQASKFKLLPVKIPDLWSLRSLELDFAYALREEKFPIAGKANIDSSLGGSTIPEKEAEVRRLEYQISKSDKSNTALLQALKSQLATLQIELPPRQESDAFETIVIANNQGADIKNQFNGGTFNNPVFNYGSGESLDLSRKSPEEILVAMSNLEEAEKAILSVFAVLPAEPVTYTALDELLPGTENLEKILRKLAQQGLIAYNEKDASFTCSPVVQEVTRRQNREKLFEHGKLLIATLIEKLDYEPGIGHFFNATYSEAALFAHYAESILKTISNADNQLAILAERVGNFHQTTGNLDKALTFFEEYFQLRKELYEVYPQNVEFKNGLAISYSKLGNTHSALGNLDKALTFYEQDAQLSKELYEVYPQNVEFKNGLAISYEKLGVTHSALGNLDKALTFFNDETRLFEELFEAYPQNVSFKNNLAVSYQYLGITHSALGNLDKALTFYEDYSRLEKELYEAYPQNVEFKYGLAISYQCLGNTHSALGNLDKALTFYEDFSRLEKELFEAYPQNVSFKNGLAISYEKLGGTHSALGNLDKAFTFFNDETGLFEELYEAYPQNVSFKNNLAISYEKLGETHSSLGNLDKALTFFEQDAQLTKELYEAYPQNVSFKNGLAVSYAKLGVFNRDERSDNVKARSYFEQAKALWAQLLEDSPSNAEFQKNWSWVNDVLEKLQQAETPC